MIHNFPYKSVIFMPVAMTIFITGAAYVMGKTVNSGGSGAASAAVAFVIAGTWLCGAALGICDRVAMKSLELQQARFEAETKPVPEFREWNTIAEPVRLEVTPTSAIYVHLPPKITRAQMQKFAFGVLHAGTPITVKEQTGNGKTFSKTEFADLVKVMLQNELVRYRTRDVYGGVVLTELGQRFLAGYDQRPTGHLTLRRLNPGERQTPERQTHAEKWVSGGK